MTYTIESLKHKLRSLKRMELRIRFGDRPLPSARLVWDAFFTTTLESKPVKYPLAYLQTLDRNGFKLVVDDYYYHIFAQLLEDETGGDVYDPHLLAELGLPPYATTADVKRCFRELAKQHHPDHGGDSAQFIALMETYNKLRAGRG